jgi:hypothetical protein
MGIQKQIKQRVVQAVSNRLSAGREEIQQDHNQAVLWKATKPNEVTAFSDISVPQGPEL